MEGTYSNQIGIVVDPMINHPQNYPKWVVVVFFVGLPTFAIYGLFTHCHSTGSLETPVIKYYIGFSSC